jgi:hypothetical protein
MRTRRPLRLAGAAIIGLAATVAGGLPADAGPAGRAPALPNAFAALQKAASSKDAVNQALTRYNARKKGPSAPVPVLRGLNNPRQLALTTGGGLLVAETGNGNGGSRCQVLPTPEGPSQQCIGTSGAVAWVPAPAVQRNARPIRVVKGLVSAAGPDGSFAGGASGVSARSFRTIYSIQTYAPPAFPVPAPLRAQIGSLLRSHPFRNDTRPIANVSAYERTNDPDRQGFDSNPYSVLDLGSRVLVADAAGNDILQYRNGRLSTFAVLPNVQTGACAGRPNDRGTTGCDAVPTSLALGPDGAIYVGGLSALEVGQGRVYKLDPRTGRVLRTWGGFTAVTGVAVGNDGSVHASQLFTRFTSRGPDFLSGKVTRVKRNGTRTDVLVPQPAGLAVDRHHNVYVAAWSLSPANGAFGPNSDGQVWRMRF